MVMPSVFLSSFRLLITNLSDVTLKNGGGKTPDGWQLPVDVSVFLTSLCQSLYIKSVSAPPLLYKGAAVDSFTKLGSIPFIIFSFFLNPLTKKAIFLMQPLSFFPPPCCFKASPSV